MVVHCRCLPDGDGCQAEKTTCIDTAVEHVTSSRMKPYSLLYNRLWQRSNWLFYLQTPELNPQSHYSFSKTPALQLQRPLRKCRIDYSRSVRPISAPRTGCLPFGLLFSFVCFASLRTMGSPARAVSFLTDLTSWHTATFCADSTNLFDATALHGLKVTSSTAGRMVCDFPVHKRVQNRFGTLHGGCIGRFQ